MKPTAVSTLMRSKSWPTALTLCGDQSSAILLITHYQRLLNYIVPDHVHVMVAGRIVRSGGKELALELEERGYDWARQDEPRNGDPIRMTP